MANICRVEAEGGKIVANLLFLPTRGKYCLYIFYKEVYHGDNDFYFEAYYMPLSIIHMIAENPEKFLVDTDEIKNLPGVTPRFDPLSGGKQVTDFIVNDSEMQKIFLMFQKDQDAHYNIIDFGRRLITSLTGCVEHNKISITDDELEDFSNLVDNMIGNIETTSEPSIVDVCKEYNRLRN